MFLAPDKGKGTERERSFTTDCGMYWEGNPKIRSEVERNYLKKWGLQTIYSIFIKINIFLN